jgi:DNA invertase Pin-like site-specific DNA recombinase
LVIASKTKRGVGYIRVSTPGQTGEHHSSLETQEASYINYCKQYDIAPVASFTDVVSGRRDDRKEYRRMVDFVLQGGADVVIVKFLDRFGKMMTCLSYAVILSNAPTMAKISASINDMING